MSDNISQLHPQKHPGLGKRIAVFAVLLVFVTGGVAAYVFRDRLNLDALQRYVRYLNVSEDSKTGRFVYDESNSNRYAGLSGGLSVASATGLSLYDKDGVETASIQASMSAPVLKTGGDLALAYDTGGNTLEAASQKRGSVLPFHPRSRFWTRILRLTAASAIYPVSQAIAPCSMSTTASRR
ncbi:MAG: DUF5711 family protein [Oscillospiraceae bacterium]